MDFSKSKEEISKILSKLKKEKKYIPIIVEGEKDKKALRKLDINNEIIVINKGISIIDFCDNLANKYSEVIILTDWDRKGGFLKRKIKKNLEGRVKCNLKFRELFAKNTIIKTVEGLPHLIYTMSEKNNLKNNG